MTTDFERNADATPPDTLARRCLLGGAVVAALGAAIPVSAGRVGNLPYAQGRTFATLDEYLAFLERLGTMDIPYYERLPDGRYRYITGRGTQHRPPEIYTRTELMEKYGFDR